jgi:hypothetical protein
MTTAGKNRIMIFGPKTDGTYVVELRWQLCPIKNGRVGVTISCDLHGCSNRRRPNVPGQSAGS